MKRRPADDVRPNETFVILSPPPHIKICRYLGVGNGLVGANPAVNTPRPSRGTRIESCAFIVLIGDP